MDDPAAALLPEPLPGEVRVLLADDQCVPAVTLVRDRTARRPRSGHLVAPQTVVTG